jgi:hypothetical protein
VLVRVPPTNNHNEKSMDEVCVNHESGDDGDGGMR